MVSQFLNISTDTTLGGNGASDKIIASQKAVKTYVDNHSGGSTPDLSGYAKTDFSNVTVPYIVETYKNEDNWYRIWSDGWCEQSGRANGSGVLVTLLKPYADSYTINLGGGNSTGWGTNSHSFTYYDITSSTFRIRMEEGSKTAPGMNCTWVTFGYIE